MAAKGLQPGGGVSGSGSGSRCAPTPTLLESWRPQSTAASSRTCVRWSVTPYSRATAHSTIAWLTNPANSLTGTTRDSQPKAPGEAATRVFSAPMRCTHQWMRSSRPIRSQAAVPGRSAALTNCAPAFRARSVAPGPRPTARRRRRIRSSRIRSLSRRGGRNRWWVRRRRPIGSASASRFSSGLMTATARPSTSATSASVRAECGFGKRPIPVIVVGDDDRYQGWVNHPAFRVHETPRACRTSPPPTR